MRNCQKGFTYIELWFCVALIGLLASITIPMFRTYRTSGQVVEALMIGRNVQVTIGEFYAHRGVFPKDNAIAGVPPPSDLHGARIDRVEIEHGAMHIYFMEDTISEDFITTENSDDGVKVQAVISIRPALIENSDEAGAISWLCGHSQPLENMQEFGTNRTNLKHTILPLTCL